jgi:tRNA(Ile)-lysidine synthase
MRVPPTGSFLDNVDRTISIHHMFRSGDSVLVGVSGGPDSVALFHILSAFISKYSIRLGIAHVNHCLRPGDSDRDARFVSSFAQRHQVPFFLGKKNVRAYAASHKLSIEEAGRRARYEYLTSVANRKGYDKIALGHHADDNAESVLMYLIRGSGLKGLSGIDPVREGKIIRPIIRQTRSEILNYLENQQIDYVTDASNTDEKYLRNRIRHQLIPLLARTYNPNIIDNLNRLSDIVRSDDHWITDQTQPVIEKSVIKAEKGRVTLSIPLMASQHEAVQRRLLRCMIERVKGDLRRITYAHIEAIRNLALTGPSHGRLDLPDRILITRNKEVLTLSKEKQPLRHLTSPAGSAAEKGYAYPIQASDIVFIRELGMGVKTSPVPIEPLPDFEAAGQMVAFFDMNTLEFPLILRNFQQGDRFSPLGIKGSQKIKDYLINNKVPRKKRAR